MSTAMLVRALEKQNVRFPQGVEPGKLLAKQTHLHLNGLRVNCLSRDLKAMSKLEVLYLYDNLLQKVDGLSGLSRLTHLYLQNNYLESLEGISGLPNLTKLYLQVGA